MTEDIPHIEAPDRKSWRAWLQKNHLTKKKVAVIVHKKHTGKPSLSHREYMEEAICFGWIDTIVKRQDEDTYLRYFCRRTDKSNWSTNTLSYAKRLIKEGRMAPEGLRRYRQGLKKKPHDHGLAKNPDVPEDLRKALGRNRKAEAFFDGLAPSYRRVYIHIIERVKTPETRKRKIRKVVERCAKGKKHNDA